MGGTIFKRHISALVPPWWYIISPPFTAMTAMRTLTQKMALATSKKTPAQSQSFLRSLGLFSCGCPDAID
jgi:hypothetical protein